MERNTLGAQINSALYLFCVFLAGIWTNHPWAWQLAIVAVAVTYLSYLAFAVATSSLDMARSLTIGIGNAFVVVSIFTGIIAGLLLLI